MTIVNKARRLPLALISCVLALATACAAPAPRTDTIGSRAQARWDLLLAGDLLAAYAFLTPGQRSAMTALEYQRSVLATRIQWKDASYIESDCTESVCNVKILLKFALYSPVPGVTAYEGEKSTVEKWVNMENQWWYVPE